MNSQFFNSTAAGKSWGILLLCLFSLPASAATTWQSLEDIRASALRHVAAAVDGDDTRINISALDKRLRLEKCSRPLHTETASGSTAGANVTVAVRCDQPQWLLMVPVKLQLTRYVVVARQPLVRGRLLTPQDIELAKRAVSSLPLGYLTQNEDLIGKRVKRYIPAGAVISPASVEASPVIIRGEQVVLLVKSAVLEVRMMGEALSDGRPNELIKVRNLQSRRIVEGVVLASGEVRVRM